MRSDALFSDCSCYRYMLLRQWRGDVPMIGIVALNPSTADAEHDDKTTHKCIKLAKHWGYGGILLLNLFAWRATNSAELRSIEDPIGPENDTIIRKTLEKVNDVLVAWGNNGIHLNRSLAMQTMLSALPKTVYCLKKNRSGEPVHPLYQRNDTPLQKFPILLDNIGRQTL